MSSTAARLGLLLLAALSVTRALAASSQSSLTPEALAPRVAEAEQTGSAIFRHDHAASVATDALDTIDFRQDNRLAGWITEEQGDSVVVTFIGGEGRKPQLALYRVTVSAEGKAGEPEELKPGVPLTADQLAQAAARAIAARQKFEIMCTPQFNTVVLPRVSGDKRTWVVYMLPGTTEASTVPFGGAYRVETDSKGSRVVSKRAFLKSCVQMPTGDDMASMVMTHLLDPHPTEIHVFLSMLVRKPIFVATAENAFIWVVKDGKIAFVERIEDDKK